MKNNSESGQVNLLLLSTILFCLTTLIAVGGLAYYYSEYVTARDKKNVAITEAVALATEQQQAILEAEFVEREKAPFRTYSSSTVLSSISFDYPKTWDLMLTETESGSPQINGTLHPDRVQLDNAGERSYALRFELRSRLYAQEIIRYESDVKRGSLVSKAVSVSEVQGVRFDGQITSDDRGALVALPVRDKTLIIWTESEDFIEDFNKVIKSLSFVP